MSVIKSPGASFCARLADIFKGALFNCFAMAKHGNAKSPIFKSGGISINPLISSSDSGISAFNKSTIFLIKISILFLLNKLSVW